MKKRIVSVFLLGLLCGCGGGGAGPSGVPGGGTTTLTFVSGETGEPVAGAVVTVGGNAPATTDAAGAINVSVSSGTEMRAEASGFFVRNTVYRGDPRLTLWPVRAGADATFVQELVYNQLIADGALTRPVVNVTFVPTQVLRDAPGVRQIHEAAAAKLTAALNGVITYSVADSAAAGSVVFEVKVDPNDSYFANNSGFQAVTRVGQIRNRIQSGSITFRSVHDAGVTSLVTHEMGHAFGLGHPAQAGLMSPGTIGSFPDYTAAEKLEMRVMLQRLPGNRPPDDDRGASVSSAGSRTLTFACGTEAFP
jgi:hypothetical protein